MNASHSESPLAEATRLATLYFDGFSSLDQERRLRILLADPALRSDLLDEARAVMGYALFSPVPAAAATPSRCPDLWIRRAAAVAAVLAAAISFLSAPAPSVSVATPEAQCVAYVGGQKITDPDAVLAMVYSDLSEFSEVSSELSEQIDGQLSEFADLQL